jgi:hypothetical protein
MKIESLARPQILADTSAWISAFHRQGYQSLKEKLDVALESNVLAICGAVLCELLQGAKNVDEYERLRSRVRALHYLSTPEQTWEKAAKLSFSLRRRGLSTPTIDIVIAQTAIDNDCALLHNDKHFELIAKYTSLRIVSLTLSR